MGTIDKILLLMKNNNIAQKTLAEAIGVRKQTISDWKSGKTKSYMRYINKIADFFNVSVDYLLDKTDDESPSAQKTINLFDNVDMNAFSRQLYELTEDERDKVQEYILFLISQRPKNEKNNK